VREYDNTSLRSHREQSLNKRGLRRFSQDRDVRRPAHESPLERYVIEILLENAKTAIITQDDRQPSRDNTLEARNHNRHWLRGACRRTDP
jgi:hypothetical protein